jgi:H+-translocating NAD(P) transhydrogenase subunit alpha
MIELFALVTFFILAVFVGYEIITKVPPTLHTPLMSITNAICGIIIVGALLAVPASEPKLATILGTIAVGLASVNVFGGFMITDRMLKMFKRAK